MKLTIEQFKNLISQHGWKRRQEITVSDGEIVSAEDVDEDGELVSEKISRVWGFAVKESEFECVKIIYTERFNYQEYNAESLSTDTDNIDDVWVIEGAVVVDEDGEQLDQRELSLILKSSLFDSIDYSELEIDKTENLNEDESAPDGVEFILYVDNAPNLRFRGVLLGKAGSSLDTASGDNYSGQPGRWRELYLYKTAGGKFVGYQIGKTLFQGERDKLKASVCENLDEVKAFFGSGWLAKDLYSTAGIDDCIAIK